MAKIKTDTLELFSDIKFIYDGLLERSEGQSLTPLAAYFEAPNTIPYLDGKKGVRTYAKIMDWAFFGNTKADYPIYALNNYRAIKSDTSTFSFKDFGGYPGPDTTSKVLAQFPTYPAENELVLTAFKIYRLLAPITTIYKDLRTAQRLLMSPESGVQIPQISWTWHPVDGQATTETGQDRTMRGMFDGAILFQCRERNRASFSDNFSASVNFHKIKSGYMMPVFCIQTSAQRPQPLKYLLWDPIALTPTQTGFDIPLGTFNRSLWETVIQRGGYDPFDGSRQLVIPYTYWDLTLDLQTDIEADS